MNAFAFAFFVLKVLPKAKTRNLDFKGAAAQAVFAQESLKRAPLFAGGFGGVGDVAAICGQEFCQITTFEGFDRA